MTMAKMVVSVPMILEIEFDEPFAPEVNEHADKVGVGVGVEEVHNILHQNKPTQKLEMEVESAVESERVSVTDIYRPNGYTIEDMQTE